MADNHLKELKYIEENYPVEKIKYKGGQLWSYFRVSIISRYMETDAEVKKSSKIITALKSLNKIRIFRLGFFAVKYGFILIKGILHSDLFRFHKKDCEYFFNGVDAVEIKLIDGKRKHRLAQELFEQVPDLIPIANLVDKMKYCTNKYVGHQFVEALILMRCVFSKFSEAEFEGGEILDSILQYLNVEFDYKNSAKFFDSAVKYFIALFKKFCPKRIFIECYYSDMYMSAIYAAKKLGIPTVELQHGTIINHRSYSHVYSKLQDNIYPEYLLTFGQKSSDCLSENFMKQDKAINVGSYWIDYIVSSKEKNAELFAQKYGRLIEQGKILISVSCQGIYDSLLRFCLEVSAVHPEYCFILSPRPVAHDYSWIKNENFFVERELDVYQCMQNCAVSVTVNSTTWMESLPLGTPAIAVNVADAPKFDMDFIADVNAVSVVETVEEFASAVERLSKMDREAVRKDGHLFFAENHKEQMRMALERISSFGI